MSIGGSAAATGAMRLRLGMVGGGQGAFIGAVHRLSSRMDDRYVLVAGALSSEPERARASGLELGLAEDRIYGDFAEMATREAARDDGIDVVSIVTPNHLHFPVAKAFLEAGIDVICDKPMTRTVAEAEQLVDLVARSGRVFCLTHNYTGYPLVRHARELVRSGALGKIRVVQVEYAQDWLSTALETTGHKQAGWRTDPAQTGAGGCIGDIGTHAYNLARFITDLSVEDVSAQLTTFVPGRQVDDDVQVMMRFAGGARGMLWASQVAAGKENSLKLRIFGEKAGLEWRQEDPNQMLFTPLGEPQQILTRGGPGISEVAGRVTRVPAGHPEGYLEAFATLYSDAAELIAARRAGREPDEAAGLVPSVEDGADGMRFIHAVVSSSNAGGDWTPLRA
ncbi:MAG: Gfo/Idh/MocA family protein [Alphaproteobacteria bacterium]